MPTVVLTSGEPAGIGPDIVLAAAQQPLPCRLVVLADLELLRDRAQLLGLSISLKRIDDAADAGVHQAGELYVLHHPLYAVSEPGVLNPKNAAYVLDQLTTAANLASSHPNHAVVTAPVQKSVINEAGIAFSGHTEFFAAHSKADVVMMLIAGELRVALATTHLPLRAVPDAINQEHLRRLLGIIAAGLKTNYGIDTPTIAVLGLNPHAGESGHMGNEEIETIQPACEEARARGLNIVGPLPADTAFTPAIEAETDAFLAMYHDQGLPVLKSRSFGQAVNVTLGLPYLRTSVDHGTALDLAGTGQAKPESLMAAINEALRATASQYQAGN